MKGRTVLGYPEQTENCFAGFCQQPHYPFEIAALFFKYAYGTTLTRSCYSAAKARFESLPVAKPNEKYAFLHALFTLFPKTTTPEARAKCRVFYGQDTRADIVETWRRRAQETPMAEDEARRTLEACPTRVHPNFSGVIESFDLLGDSA